MNERQRCLGCQQEFVEGVDDPGESRCRLCREWDEPEVESTECSLCGGPLMELGALGRLTHYRCRNCGMQCSKENQ